MERRVFTRRRTADVKREEVVDVLHHFEEGWRPVEVCVESGGVGHHGMVRPRYGRHGVGGDVVGPILTELDVNAGDLHVVDHDAERGARSQVFVIGHLLHSVEHRHQKHHAQEP